MKATYVLTEYNDRKTGFLFEDNRLMKTCFLHNESIIGNIYVAKVANIVKSINAAFLDIGSGDYLYYPILDNEGKHIFTHHGNSNKVCVGDELLVQIKKDPIKTKKGEAGGNLEFKGRFLIINRSGEVGISRKIEDADKRNVLKVFIEKKINEFESGESVSDILNAGAIIRTNAVEASEEDIAAELSELLTLMNDIIKSSEHSVCKKCLYENSTSVYDEITELVSSKRYESYKIITDLEDVYSDLC